MQDAGPEALCSQGRFSNCAHTGQKQNEPKTRHREQQHRDHQKDHNLSLNPKPLSP